MQKFKYEAECPQCRSFVPVVGWKTNKFRPEFARHNVGRRRGNNYCWGSGFPIQNHHPKRELIDKITPILLKDPEIPLESR